MQGSPNIQNPDNQPRRRAIAVTAMRPGLSGEPYLYTLNMVCPEAYWDVLGPVYQQAAQSFRLAAPGRVSTLPLHLSCTCSEAVQRPGLAELHPIIMRPYCDGIHELINPRRFGTGSDVHSNPRRFGTGSDVHLGSMARLQLQLQPSLIISRHISLHHQFGNSISQATHQPAMDGDFTLMMRIVLAVTRCPNCAGVCCPRQRPVAILVTSTFTGLITTQLFLDCSYYQKISLESKCRCYRYLTSGEPKKLKQRTEAGCPCSS